MLVVNCAESTRPIDGDDETQLPSPRKGHVVVAVIGAVVLQEPLARSSLIYRL